MQIKKQKNVRYTNTKNGTECTITTNYKYNGNDLDAWPQSHPAPTDRGRGDDRPPPPPAVRRRGLIVAVVESSASSEGGGGGGAVRPAPSSLDVVVVVVVVVADAHHSDRPVLRIPPPPLLPLPRRRHRRRLFLPSSPSSSPPPRPPRPPPATRHPDPLVRGGDARPDPPRGRRGRGRGHRIVRAVAHARGDGARRRRSEGVARSAGRRRDDGRLRRRRRRPPRIDECRDDDDDDDLRRGLRGFPRRACLRPRTPRGRPVRVGSRPGVRDDEVPAVPRLLARSDGAAAHGAGGTGVEAPRADADGAAPRGAVGDVVVGVDRRGRRGWVAADDERAGEGGALGGVSPVGGADERQHAGARADVRVLRGGIRDGSDCAEGQDGHRGRADRRIVGCVRRRREGLRRSVRTSRRGGGRRSSSPPPPPPGLRCRGGRVTAAGPCSPPPRGKGEKSGLRCSFGARACRVRVGSIVEEHSLRGCSFYSEEGVRARIWTYWRGKDWHRWWRPTVEFKEC